MQAGTILIVDDNKSVLTSLELLLEDEFEGWRLPRTRTVSFRSWTVGRLILSCWI